VYTSVGNAVDGYAAIEREQPGMEKPVEAGRKEVYVDGQRLVYPDKKVIIDGKYKMYQSLDILTWHQMAQEGTFLPVRICINGVSMYPLIRKSRDYVTIVPLDTRPVVGEIVLFADPACNRYVLHRVWKVKNDQILTWGDNCNRPDRWIPAEAVWGKVILIERGKQRIKPNMTGGILLAGFWHLFGRAYRRGRYLAGNVFRAFRKVL